MNSPSQLGKYRIVREIGRGSMGVVYEGFDPSIQRRVAIKVVREADLDPIERGELHARLEREAQAAGRLNHPNIVAVYDFGEDTASSSTRVAFIAMELVDGTELKSLFDAGRSFSMPEIVRVMTAILVALQHAHERGVVHRDVKPGNVILLADGGVKLTDFGVARLENSEMTRAGTIIGSPQYMAPEQLLGLPVDGRADLFSCGVILYQFLTGTKPFNGSVATVMQQVLNVDPVPPSRLNTTLFPVWDSVLGKAMAKTPEARYQRADDMAAAIRQAATGIDEDATVIQRPPHEVLAPMAAPGPPRRRLPGQLLTALVLGAATMIGAWIWLKPAATTNAVVAVAPSSTPSSPTTALQPDAAASDTTPPSTARPITPRPIATSSSAAAPIVTPPVATPPSTPRPSTASALDTARTVNPPSKASAIRPAPVAPALSKHETVQPAAPALRTTLPAPSAPSPGLADATNWRQLAGQLASSSQAYTLGKALTLLLDVSADEDRRKMIELDTRVLLLPANVHLAMGTRDGFLVYAWSTKAVNMPDADAIVRRCELVPAQNCRLIVTRNTFNRARLVEVAAQLNGRQQAEVRTRSMAAIERMLVGLRVLAADDATASPTQSSAPVAAARAPAAAPSVPTTAAPLPTLEWEAARLALRSQASGTGFSTAMAVLLQASSADEVDVLNRFEAGMKRLPWKSALAMGVIRNGHVAYGYSSREATLDWAVEGAIKACSRYTAEPCVVVMRNGVLVDSGLQALAAKLGPMPQGVVRRALIQTMQKSPTLQ
ncbi:MAG: protein kinase [Ideonella sp.]|nr:protein kinase [Ideonella sp.]